MENSPQNRSNSNSETKQLGNNRETSKKTKRDRARSRLDPEKYARLKAEAAAPYRGLRKFFYVAFGAPGFIGATIFLAQLAAGRNVTSALPNFALQVGVVALMIFCFRWEQKTEEKKSNRKNF